MEGKGKPQNEAKGQRVTGADELKSILAKEGESEGHHTFGDLFIH